MKKILLLLVISALGIGGAYSQSTQLSAAQQKKADSDRASAEVHNLMRYLSLTAAQQHDLFEAGMIISKKRRNVLNQYRNQPSFHEEIAKVNREADTLILSILGQTAYQRLKDSVQAQMVLKKAISDSVRRHFSKSDTLIHKRKTP